MQCNIGHEKLIYEIHGAAADFAFQIYIVLICIYFALPICLQNVKYIYGIFMHI